MGTLLIRLEVIGKSSEFFSRKYNLAHVQSNSKLSLSDVATSKFIKVSEELANSDSLFLADLSKLGNYIFDIIWDIFFNIDTCNSWSSLWIVFEGVVETSSNSKELLWGIDIITEIEIVDLINVTLVHIGFAKGIQNSFWSANSELTKSSQELMLSNMLIFGNIKVLEHWLKVNSLDSDGFFILF